MTKINKVPFGGRFTFDNFISSIPENDKAIALRFTINRPSGRVLIISGKQGNGSTHLLSAIAVELKKTASSFCYLSSHVLEKAARGSFQPLRLKLEQVDSVLLDDWPALWKDTSLKKRVLHLLKGLIHSQKNIAFSCPNAHESLVDLLRISPGDTDFIYTRKPRWSLVKEDLVFQRIEKPYWEHFTKKEYKQYANMREWMGGVESKRVMLGFKD